MSITKKDALIVELSLRLKSKTFVAVNVATQNASIFHLNLSQLKKLGVGILYD
jgi:hypothetical protein